MADSIKSPAGDVLGNGHNPFSKPGGGGEFNGEPGYQKRTPSSNGVPELTHDGTAFEKMKGIKTPGSDASKG
jgi:hypothetical protein